jgi:hypothetical protein
MGTNVAGGVGGVHSVNMKLSEHAKHRPPTTFHIVGWRFTQIPDHGGFALTL